MSSNADSTQGYITDVHDSPTALGPHARTSEMFGMVAEMAKKRMPAVRAAPCEWCCEVVREDWTVFMRLTTASTVAPRVQSFNWCTCSGGRGSGLPWQ